MPLLPSVVTRPASQWVELARGSVGGFTWGPSLAAAKWAARSLFSNIQHGTLIVEDQVDGTKELYGESLGGAKAPGKLVNGEGHTGGPPRVVLVVKKSNFWMRLVLFADMGFAEAFLLGEFECSNLTAFFEV